VQYRAKNRRLATDILLTKLPYKHINTSINNSGGWLDSVGFCWLRLAFVGFCCFGRLWWALVGSGGLWWALVGFGWLWLALAESCCLWLPLPGFGRLRGWIVTGPRLGHSGLSRLMQMIARIASGPKRSVSDKPHMGDAPLLLHHAGELVF